MAHTLASRRTVAAALTLAAGLASAQTTVGLDLSDLDLLVDENPALGELQFSDPTLTADSPLPAARVYSYDFVDAFLEAIPNDGSNLLSLLFAATPIDELDFISVLLATDGLDLTAIGLGSIELTPQFIGFLQLGVRNTTGELPFTIIELPLDEANGTNLTVELDENGFASFGITNFSVFTEALLAEQGIEFLLDSGSPGASSPLGGISFASGSTLELTALDTPVQVSEFQFDVLDPSFDDMVDDSVFNQSADPMVTIPGFEFVRGAAKIRAYDDTAFAPLLEGDYPDARPNPGIPTGITAKQDRFGMASEFTLSDGSPLPLPGGVDVPVYFSGDPRNTETGPITSVITPPDLLPSDEVDRAVGLAVWPNTYPGVPTRTLFTWSVVADLLLELPEGFQIPAPGEPSMFLAQILNDESLNKDDGGVSFRVRSDGTLEAGWNDLDVQDIIGTDPVTGDPIVSSTSRKGLMVPTGVDISSGSTGWFRFGFTCQIIATGEGEARSVVYIDGAKVGELDGAFAADLADNTDYEGQGSDGIGSDVADLLNNQVDGTNPEWPDSRGVPGGNPIDPALWSAWGEFPNPWGQSPAVLIDQNGNPFTSNIRPESTFGLFSTPGEAAPFYVAAVAFADAEIPEAVMAALGGVNAGGIFFAEDTGPVACNAADLDADGDNDVFDALAFISAYNPAMPSPVADLDGNGTNDVFDALNFISAYSPTLCPSVN